MSGLRSPGLSLRQAHMDCRTTQVARGAEALTCSTEQVVRGEGGLLSQAPTGGFSSGDRDPRAPPLPPATLLQLLMRPPQPSPT